MANPKISIQLQADIKQLQDTINQVDKKFDDMADNINKGSDKAGGGLQNLGMTALGLEAIFRIVGGAIEKTFGQAIQVAQDFEFQMAKVQAVAGGSDEELSMLSDSALAFGESTAFTAMEVAKLQQELAKLGFDPQQIKDSTEAILDLAFAFDNDLDRTAVVVAQTLNGFNMEATESARVADVMAVAFSSSALDLEKFANTMTYLAPVASSVGFTIEETTAIMASLADIGIDSSIAGTALRRTFMNMADAGSDLSQVLGGTVGSFDEFAEALYTLGNANVDFSTTLSFMDARTAGVFQKLIEGADNVEDFKDQLLKADGTTRDMADTMMETAEGSTRALNSAIEGLNQKFGEMLIPTLSDAKTALAEWIREIDPEEIKAYASGMGLVTLGVMAYYRATLMAIVATKGFKVALASTGIGLLIVGLGSLIGMLIDSTDYFAEETEAIEDNTQAWSDNFEKVDETSTARDRFRGVVNIDDLEKERDKLSKLTETYKQLFIQKAEMLDLDSDMLATYMLNQITLGNLEEASKAMAVSLIDATIAQQVFGIQLSKNEQGASMATRSGENYSNMLHLITNETQEIVVGNQRFMVDALKLSATFDELALGSENYEKQMLSLLKNAKEHAIAFLGMHKPNTIVLDGHESMVVATKDLAHAFNLTSGSVGTQRDQFEHLLPFIMKTAEEQKEIVQNNINQNVTQEALNRTILLTAFGMSPWLDAKKMLNAEQRKTIKNQIEEVQQMKILIADHVRSVEAINLQIDSLKKLNLTKDESVDIIEKETKVRKELLKIMGQEIDLLKEGSKIGKTSHELRILRIEEERKKAIANVDAQIAKRDELKKILAEKVLKDDDFTQEMMDAEVATYSDGVKEKEAINLHFNKVVEEAENQRAERVRQLQLEAGEYEFQVMLDTVNAKIALYGKDTEEYWKALQEREALFDQHRQKQEELGITQSFKQIQLMADEMQQAEITSERKTELALGMLDLTQNLANEHGNIVKAMFKQEAIDFITAQQVKMIATLAQLIASSAKSFGLELVPKLAIYAGGVAMLQVAKTKIQAMEVGGLVKDPTLALIGEGGEPELVIPESGFKDYVKNTIVPMQHKMLQDPQMMASFNNDYQNTFSMKNQRQEYLTEQNTNAILGIQKEIQQLNKSLGEPQSAMITDGSTITNGTVKRGSF